MDRVEDAREAGRFGGRAHSGRAGGAGSALAVVADASALLDYLLGNDPSGAIAGVVRQVGADLHAPSFCDIEVTSGLRRALRRGDITERRATEALVGYLWLPLTRHEHLLLLGRILELRHNFTAHDATYVALAERLGADLLTADGALERAVKAHTELMVLPGSADSISGASL